MGRVSQSVWIGRRACAIPLAKTVDIWLIPGGVVWERRLWRSLPFSSPMADVTLFLLDGGGGCASSLTLAARGGTEPKIPQSVSYMVLHLHIGTTRTPHLAYPYHALGGGLCHFNIGTTPQLGRARKPVGGLDNLWAVGGDLVGCECRSQGAELDFVAGEGVVQVGEPLLDFLSW